MCPRPLPYVREAAGVLHKCPQVQLIAGHSAHNIQGTRNQCSIRAQIASFLSDVAVL
jgi:hypothetical protein